MKLTELDHKAGDESAPITLVQYGDYMSGECKIAHDAIMRVLDTLPGAVRFAYRHFVHDRVNKDGFVAALAAEAAGAQGSFWEFHNDMMQLAGAVTSPDIVKIAEENGLDMTRFLRDISHKTYGAKIKDDLESGAVNGVMVVPTFFINGARIMGNCDADTLVRAVRACL